MSSKKNQILCGKIGGLVGIPRGPWLPWGEVAARSIAARLNGKSQLKSSSPRRFFMQRPNGKHWIMKGPKTMPNMLTLMVAALVAAPAAA